MKFKLMNVIILAVLFTAPAFALELTNLNLPQDADPGQTIQGSFNITNNASTIQTISFSSTDMVYSVYHFNGTSINAITLNPGESRIINFNLVIPEKQFYGSYTGTITATNGSESKSLTLHINVNPQPAFSINNSLSLTVPQGMSRTLQLRITNDGNTALTGVNVAFSNLTHGSYTFNGVSVNENNFVVNYNSYKDVIITVTVPANAVAGVYSGTYTVTPAGLNGKTGSIQVTVTEPVYSIEAPDDVTFNDAERDKTLSKTFTIKNNGDLPLENLTITTDADSSYNVKFENAPSSLQVGESKTITVKLKIPDDEDSGLKEIGKIIINTKNLNKEIPLRINPENMLNIRDLDFYVNGKDNDVDEDGGDTVKVKPGDEVEVKAKVENLFSSSSGVDLNDVSMDITIEGIDDGDDIEEESDTVRIRADRYEVLSLKFDVPLKVDEDTYPVTIEIRGEDDNGAEHTVTIDMDIEVEKDAHDLRITKFDVVPDTITCQRTVQIETEITNLGSRDEDEVVYTVKSNALGIDMTYGKPGDYLYLSSDYEDEDNSISRTVTATIPDDVKPGTYNIEMRLYRNRDDLVAIKIAKLTVNKCSVNEEPKNDEQKDTENKTVEVVYTTTGTSGPVIAQEENKSIFSGLNSSEWLIIGILGGLVVLLLIVVIVLILK